LYGCGLRVGELAGLDAVPGPDTQRQGRGWIDLEAAEAHVFGKGSKRRSVPVGSAALAALRAWLEVRLQPFGAASG
ncbi:recombinase XerC, partial [Azospirillum brasilense]